MFQKDSQSSRSCRFREWVPVGESLPAQDGLYSTLIKPILGKPFEKDQRYTKQANSAISGWQHMPVTHWRAV